MSFAIVVLIDLNVLNVVYLYKFKEFYQKIANVQTGYMEL